MMRKSSKQPPVNYDESGLLQQEEFADPSFFQPMNEEPVLSRRLSQQPRLSTRPSTTRPSFANAQHHVPGRQLLPMQEMSATPQWQGRNERNLSPPRHTSRQRQSLSPPPAAVVTPPEPSSDKKNHKHSHRKSKSAAKPKSRKSHRHSTSNNNERRSSSRDRLEVVEGVDQGHLHPAIQEHILAELQMAQSNKMDAMFAQIQNQDHQQLRDERQRRRREKKRNKKKGWFGRKSNHSRSNHSRTRSPDTSISSTDSFAPPPAPTAETSPRPSAAGGTPKSIGLRLRNAVLPRKKQKENTTNRNDNNRDAPSTINDPLLQQTILESIAAMNTTSEPAVEPRAPPRTRSDLQRRSRRGEEQPKTSRRRRHSQSNTRDVERRQSEQQDILDSNMERLEIGMVDQGAALESRQQRQQQQQNQRQPESSNRDRQSPKNEPTSAVDPNSELNEIAMMFPNQSTAQAQQFLLEQQAALAALQRRQQRAEREAKAPAPAPVPAARTADPKPNQTAAVQTQKVLLEQQAALEAFQRQREREAKAPAPTPVHPARAGSLKPPPDQNPIQHHSTAHLALNQMRSSENPSGNKPTLKAPPPSAAAGLPAAGSPKEELEYCGNSYDGSRSTFQEEEEEDFFDWGSVDEGPPIREAVTRDSFVSEITNPIGSDGEYYSDSEPEDYYAENYDSDDYVDEDEWERLEKALEKGGPEAARQWEEFLKKQGQMEESGLPKNETMDVKEHSGPYDGGYAPSQMADFDEEVASPKVAKAPPPMVAKAPPPMVAQAPPPPMVAKTPPAPSPGVRTTFVCECCADRKSTRNHAHSCDNLGTPHLVCSDCIKHYLETQNAKYRMMESNNKTLYQVKCFTSLDGTSCNGCNATVSFQLQSVFTLEELESWLVRQRNRLHTMARNIPPNY